MDRYSANASLAVAAEPQAPTGTMQALQQRLEALARRSMALAELSSNVKVTIVGRRPTPPLSPGTSDKPKVVAEGFIENLDSVMDLLTAGLNAIENDLQELRDKL